MTMDPAKPRAQAVAVSGGRIVAVGSDSDLDGLRNADTKVIDLAGGTLLPGLIDPHMHSAFVTFESWLDVGPFAMRNIDEVVAARIGGVGMDQDAEAGMVQHQPRHQGREHLLGERDLVHRLIVRPDLDVMPVAEPHHEAFADQGAQPLGGRARGRRIVIDVGVVARDLGQRPRRGLR